MNSKLVLVSDGLNGAGPWLSQVLRDAGIDLDVVGHDSLAAHRPADAVMVRLNGRDAARTVWALHRQGHRAVIAISPSASSAECVRLLNAGADYYLDAWLPAAELVARVRVALRFTRWFDAHREPATTVA